MRARATAIACLSVSAGCTLLSLDELVDGDGGSGANGVGSASSAGGGPGPSSGGAGGQGASGGAGGVEQAYAACVLDDDPAVYLRMDSADSTEENLGSFLGDATYQGPSIQATGLIGDEGAEPTLGARKFQAGGSLRFTTAEFTGGYQPLSVELWFTVGEAIEVAGAERFLFESEPEATTLGLSPRAVGDGLDQLSFLVSEMDVGKRSSAAFGDYLSQPMHAFHVVGVYRLTASTTFDADGVANDMALYVDGEPVSTVGTGNAMTVGQAMQTLIIGGTFGTNASGAVIDEFAVYTYELSSLDVKRHYEAGRGGSCD